MLRVISQAHRVRRATAVAIAAFVCSATLVEAQWNNDAEECYQLGTKLLMSHTDPRLAIKHCSKAIQSGDLDKEGLAVTHSSRGMAYTTAGDLQNALADFDIAIKLKSNYTDAYNNRCQLLAQLGHSERAIADCDRALELGPNAAYIYDSRGYAYRRSGNYARAIQDYDTAVQLDSKLMESYFGRGVAYIRLGKRVEGERDLATARALYPEIDVYMKKLGIVP